MRIDFVPNAVQVTGGGMHHKKGGRLPERGGRVLGVWAGEAKVTGDKDPVEDVLDRIEAHDLRNDVVGLINICARSFPLPSTPPQRSPVRTST